MTSSPRSRLFRTRRSVRALLGSLAALVVIAIVATVVTWPSKPALSGARTGDAELLAVIGSPAGYEHLSVAYVDLDAPQKLRFADIGSSRTTRYEVGSLSKALTGLVVADAVRRGELKLSDPVSKYVGLGGSPAGDATFSELVTHHAGYPRLGRATKRRGTIAAFTGGNPYTATRQDVLDEARQAGLTGRGTFAYSNLGAAVVGQAAASAVGMSYAELMQTRLFGPLAMTATTLPDHVTVPGGRAESGAPMAPWVFDGYAPAGGVVSTSQDLATFATAVLTGRAPGLDALKPVADADRAGSRIGCFWFTSTSGDGKQTITWHNGMTGGYSSFVGFDRQHQRAVVVLSDVAKPVDPIGVQLLAPK